MDKTDNRKPRRYVKWLVMAAILIVLVVYPLSIGPAYCFGFNVEGRFYRPVVFACKKIGREEALYKYMFWCNQLWRPFPRHLADPYHHPAT
jgi:hypothetical protein